ncbi:MAG TPA: SIMPL domain-containing protein [Gammaproteobacteria bacterium]|jgi:uncharacterized protein YggE
MKSITCLLFTLAALAGASSALGAGALPEGPYLIAYGSATTDAAPDYVVLTLSIDGVAPKTADASAMVDQKAAKLFDILKASGISQDDIRASVLNVAPAYDYDDNNKRSYKGQQVSREFQATLHDISKFSSLIQILLDNNLDVNGMDFGSSRKAEIEKQNLDAAIADARKRADDMASQAAEKVDRVYGMAPGEYSSFITQEFPFGEKYYGAPQLGKIEVTGSRIKRTDTYIIPKFITFSSNVTIVCTVK